MSSDAGASPKPDYKTISQPQSPNIGDVDSVSLQSARLEQELTPSLPGLLSGAREGPMTLNHADDVKHWRDRAAEMRVLSSTTKDIEAQAAMVRLADVYDKLAERAELRANCDVPPGGW
jgi:hypothetical protein